MLQRIALYFLIWGSVGALVGIFMGYPLTMIGIFLFVGAFRAILSSARL